MNPKEYMEEADRLRRRIHRKENEIRSLRAAAEDITGMSSSDMPKTVSPNPHKMEAAVCKIISLEKEVEEIKAELDHMVSEFRKSIDALGKLSPLKCISAKDRHITFIERLLSFSNEKVCSSLQFRSLECSSEV